MNKGWQGAGCRKAALAVCVALALNACGGGGGGGNVRGTFESGSGSAPPPPPPSTPAPPPAPAPAPATLPDPQPPLDAQLAYTNTYAAHAQGYTGQGVTIGVVDSGIMPNHPALIGRVLQEQIYVDPSANNTAVADVVGHGTEVAEIAAGKPVGQFAGGIAPGASLVSARIISDSAPDDNGTAPPAQVDASEGRYFDQVNGNLINAGVSVQNNSWGGITWSAADTAVTQAFHDAYNPFVNGAFNHGTGGLVVFAAGNDSQPNPSTVAALPSLAPDLEKGWLTVVATNSSNPGQLASYSNACGVAMRYCLAAPGDVIVSGKDDLSANNLTYYIVEGTSLAAPQVSGAAALVWQAYPYFSNDLVRQTLLGTADDLGAPGPDPTFGYGELDVGKAVNGPARFDWGDVTVGFSGQSSWNNAISGAGGLIKQGPGTLILSQPSSYTGLTQVQQGTLVARSLAANVSIGAQGTLQDTPNVGGSITNAGVLVAEGGDVQVGGDYAQQGNGRLAVSLGSALRVAGKATLGGGDLYVFGANQGYVANAHTDVLVANGGLSGSFTALSAPSGLLTASLGYDANSAWLDVRQVSATAVRGVSYSAATLGAAQRVQGAFDQLNAQLGGQPAAPGGASGFIAGAASLQQAVSPAQLQRSLESLSGQLHAVSAAMTFEAIDAGTRALSDRFEQLLDAPRPAVGGWTQSLGYAGSMAQGGYGNVGYDLSGYLVGADRRIGADGVAGYAISQTQGLGRLAETADQGYSHALEGMLYGGVIRNQWYAMGRLGVGTYRQNMQRGLQLGSQFAAVGSQSLGRYGVAYGESGYHARLGAWSLTPYMDLQYARVQRNGFDETGAEGFGLMAGSQTVQRWQAGLGLRAGREWRFGDGESLRLQERFLWQRALAVRGESFDASFTGLEQWAPLGGIGLSRYGGMLGTSLEWRFSPRSQLAMSYDRYMEQHVQAQTAMLSYQLAF